MQSTIAPIAGALCALLVSGCAVTSDQSAIDGDDRPLPLAVEELWSIGGIAATGWDALSDQISVAFDASGRLHVFDPLSARIHVLGVDGELERSWGDRGEGPGELSAPTHLLVQRDGSTSVLDVGKWAFVHFDPSGEYRSETRLGFDQKAFERLFPTPDGGVVTAGRGMVSDFEAAKGGIVRPPTIPIRRVPLDGRPGTTLHEAWNPPPLQGEESAGVLVRGPKTYTLPALVAFQPTLHLGTAPDGRVLVADSADWSIDVLSPTGTALGVIERDVAPIPVDEDIRSRERRVRLAGLEGQRPPMAAEDWLEVEQSRIELMLFADVVPVIAELAVDWEGRVWVARTAPDLSGNGPIDVVRLDGTYVGSIAGGAVGIPAAFGPDGTAAYIDLDDYDVPTVRVIRLAGLPG